jgi:hypothetical protein
VYIGLVFAYLITYGIGIWQANPREDMGPWGFLAKNHSNHTDTPNYSPHLIESWRIASVDWYKALIGVETGTRYPGASLPNESTEFSRDISPA